MTRAKCYACDAPAVGTRDRRPEGGALELACKRHAGPTKAELAKRQRELDKWQAVWGVGTVPR